MKKQFYAIVQETKSEEETAKVNFFRKSSKSLGNDYYVFPNVDDEMDIKITDIITIVKPVKVNRGRHTFPFALNN